MVSAADRRRYGRLMVPLSIEYRTRENGEFRQGKGMLRDISLSGTYFHAEPSASFQPGQILSLTICAHLPFMDYEEVSHIKAKGTVVRLEPPGPATPHYGVAVHFLEGPTFTSAPLSLTPAPPAF